MEDERDISRRPLSCLMAQQSPRSCLVPIAPVVLKLKEQVSESKIQRPRCMIHIPAPGSHVGLGCPAGRHRCGTRGALSKSQLASHLSGLAARLPLSLGDSRPSLCFSFL